MVLEMQHPHRNHFIRSSGKTPGMCSCLLLCHLKQGDWTNSLIESDGLVGLPRSCLPCLTNVSSMLITTCWLMTFSSFLLSSKGKAPEICCFLLCYKNREKKSVIIVKSMLSPEGKILLYSTFTCCEWVEKKSLIPVQFTHFWSSPVS